MESLNEHPFVERQAKLYQSDVTKILMAIFAASERELTPSTIYEAGLFDTPLAPHIHYDTLKRYSSNHRAPIGCVTRIGALNLQIIPSAKRQFVVKGKASFYSDEQDRIGMIKGIGRHEQNLLRQRGIVETVPLGRVVMMLGGPHGTWHGSCEESGRSAYLYTAAGIPTKAPQP
jgi:hypothetical protein